MKQIQIFIATYNRPSLVLRTIRSVLKQKFTSFDVIISDNSIDNQTETVISNLNDKRILYKRRVPSLPFINHLNAILQDVTADYFMIFHDDDEMLTNMIEILYKKINSDDSYWAVGCNALKCVNDKCTNKLLIPLMDDKIFSNGTDLALRYLNGNKVVPFPSYMYRLNVAKSIQFDNAEAGIYSDVTFLLKILQKAQVVFVNQPLMKYYFHNNQISFTNDIISRNKLIRYILKNTNIQKNNKLVVFSRLYNIYTEDVTLILKERFSLRKFIDHFRLFIKNKNFTLALKLLIRYLRIKI